MSGVSVHVRRFPRHFTRNRWFCLLERTFHIRRLLFSKQTV